LRVRAACDEISIRRFHHVQRWYPGAVSDGAKMALGVLAIVAIPFVPIVLWWRLAVGRQRHGEEVTSGRTEATPFVIIGRVGTAIAAVAVVVVLIVLVARWLVV
jgi:hypothetical protein